MTDREMNELCAVAMGHGCQYRECQDCACDDAAVLTERVHTPGFANWCYDPLNNDAQAMALVKKFNLTLTPELMEGGIHFMWFAEFQDECGACDLNVNRAIVEAVASKHKGSDAAAGVPQPEEKK